MDIVEPITDAVVAEAMEIVSSFERAALRYDPSNGGWSKARVKTLRTVIGTENALLLLWLADFACADDIEPLIQGHAVIVQQIAAKLLLSRLSRMRVRRTTSGAIRPASPRDDQWINLDDEIATETPSLRDMSDREKAVTCLLSFAETALAVAEMLELYLMHGDGVILSTSPQTALANRLREVRARALWVVRRHTIYSDYFA
jgi:hypothetical protein